MASQIAKSHALGNTAKEKPGIYETVISLLAEPEHRDRFSTLRRTLPTPGALGGRKRVVKVTSASPQLEPRYRNYPVKLEWRRSDMGHFIFDPDVGEVPLTCHDLPTPGPADYEPDYTKSSTKRKEPEYSFRNWTKTASSKTVGPGPMYNTRQSSIYPTLKQIKLKGKEKTCDQLKAKTGPGPAAYAVEHNDVGHTCEAVKTTIKGRMNSKYWPGFSSGLEMPCDAPDFLLGGEMLLRDRTSKGVGFGDSPKWSLQGRHDSTLPKGPGPANYSIPHGDALQNPQPGKTFGSYLPSVTPEEENPGPGAYLVPLTDKPKNPNPVVIPRRMPHNVKDAPAPNEYSVRGKYDKFKRDYNGRGPHITYRSHSDLNERERASLPGPSDYSAKSGHKIPGGNMAAPSRASYPDCLNYKPYIKNFVSNPSSAQYNPTNHCIGKKSAGKSFGIKHNRAKTRDVAGPGDYDIRGLTTSGRSTIPSVSMNVTDLSQGKQYKRSRRSRIPAPSDYDTSRKFDGPSFSITGKSHDTTLLSRKYGNSFGTPGPQYDLRGLTHTGTDHCISRTRGGVKIKSRGSPHVFQGMDSRGKPPTPFQFSPRRWHDNITLG